jgi:hypothetical protein
MKSTLNRAYCNYLSNDTITIQQKEIFENKFKVNRTKFKEKKISSGMSIKQFIIKTGFYFVCWLIVSLITSIYTGISLSYKYVIILVGFNFILALLFNAFFVIRASIFKWICKFCRKAKRLYYGSVK